MTDERRPLGRTIEFWIRMSIGGAGFGLAVLYYAIIRILPGGNPWRRQSFARVMSALVCRPMGLRVIYHDVDRIEQYGPCIYAPNHQSQLDYPILARIYPGNALVMASQIGKWPVMGMLWRSSGSIDLDRDVPVKAAATVTLSEQRITEHGNSIWIFVEGTRGKVRGRMGKFRRGAFRLAVTTGVPIVPIVVSPLLPETDLRGRLLVARDVHVHVLEPLYADGRNEEALSLEVRTRMEAALSRYHSG